MGFNSDGTWTPDSPLSIGLGSPVKANYNTQFQTGVNTNANAAAAGVAPEQGVTNTVLLNNGNKGLAETGWTDTVASWFRPEGDKGTSVGGNIMDAVGKGVNAATGLAGLGLSYLNTKEVKKNNKELANLRANKASAGKQAAINAGNGAVYNYGNIE